MQPWARFDITPTMRKPGLTIQVVFLLFFVGGALAGCERDSEGATPTAEESPAETLKAAQALPERNPGIYAAGLEIRAGKPQSGEALSTVLREQGYRSVSGEPERSGEFSVHGQRLTVITRTFQGLDGLLYLPQSIDINLANGALSNRLGENPKSLPLEPTRVTGPGEFLVAVGDEFKALPNIKDPDSSKFVITTAWDSQLGACAENAFQGIETPAALVALDASTGRIVSYRSKGGDFVRDKAHTKGSIIKPLTLFPALDSNLTSNFRGTLRSVIIDEQLSGPGVTLRTAIEDLRGGEIGALAKQIGAENALEMLSRLKLGTGATGSSLLDLTAAFNTLANGGVYLQPSIIMDVVDLSGNKVFSSSPTNEHLLTADAAFLFTDALRGAVERGALKELRVLGYSGPSAAVAGSSKDGADNWIVGYTPNLTLGVWGAGRAAGIASAAAESAKGEIPATYPIWARFMSCAERHHPAEEFISPESIERVSIDAVTGARFTESCSQGMAVDEYFVKGTAPVEKCESTIKAPSEVKPTPSSRPKVRYQPPVRQPTSPSTPAPVENIWRKAQRGLSGLFR